MSLGKIHYFWFWGKLSLPVSLGGFVFVSSYMVGDHRSNSSEYQDVFLRCQKHKTKKYFFPGKELTDHSDYDI